jgi:hypothetical protein
MRVSAIVASCVLASSLTVTQEKARAASQSAVEAYPVRPVRMILASGPGSFHAVSPPGHAMTGLRGAYHEWHFSESIYQVATLARLISINFFAVSTATAASRQ